MNKIHEYYTSPQFKFDDAKKMIKTGVTLEKRKIKPVSIYAKTVFQKKDDEADEADDKEDATTNLDEKVKQINAPQTLEQSQIEI